MWWILAAASASPQDAVLSFGIGTGFFVAPDQVLTAGHVADLFGPQGAAVYGWGQDPRPVSVTLVAVDRERDLALYSA
jgi:S1-C subfamily serine protease